jgi:hypothetical protein
MVLAMLFHLLALFIGQDSVHFLLRGLANFFDLGTLFFGEIQRFKGGTAIASTSSLAVFAPLPPIAPRRLSAFPLALDLGTLFIREDFINLRSRVFANFLEFGLLFLGKIEPILSMHPSLSAIASSTHLG